MSQTPHYIEIHIRDAESDNAIAALSICFPTNEKPLELFDLCARTIATHFDQARREAQKSPEAPK